MTAKNLPSTPPFDFSRVRSLRGGDVVWVCLTDVADQLGVNPSDPQLLADFLAVPEEHRALRQLISPDAGGGWEELPVVSAQGLAHVVAHSPTPAFRQVCERLVEPAVSVLLVPGLRGNPGVAARGNSVWGVQPVRHTLRGMGLSVQELVDLVNGVPSMPRGAYKHPTLSSVLLGRQLPPADLLARLEYVFQCKAEVMFSEPSLAEFERKYGPAKRSLPSFAAPASVPVSPVSPVPDLSPIPSPAPEDEDHPDLPEFPDFDAYDEAAEDELARRAGLEALGMPDAGSVEEAMEQLRSQSFESGFSVIAGSPSSSDLPFSDDPEVTSQPE